MRRQDRAVEDDAWIAAMLERSAVGVLATVANGQPYLNSNLFVFDGSAHAIYLHTARHGRTRSNVEANESVCFNVSEMGRLLPAATALEFSVEYASVTAFGRGAIVDDRAEAKRALQLLMDKYFPRLRPGRDYRAITADELDRTSVYRIAIEEWSGKRKAVEPDFPGAFHYHDRTSVGGSVA
jgi:nitroimidazol reductase NimA-like FMN-containing flavoprotein (pyridoxamine 5'-phosphate oxidase superfamily)